MSQSTISIRPVHCLCANLVFISSFSSSSLHSLHDLSHFFSPSPHLLIFKSPFHYTTILSSIIITPLFFFSYLSPYIYPYIYFFYSFTSHSLISPFLFVFLLKMLSIILVLISLMAPNVVRLKKRARRGGSSSAAPPPPPSPVHEDPDSESESGPMSLTVLLGDEDSVRRFETHFIHRKIARSRIVTQPLCEEIGANTFNLFHNMGWDFFVSLDVLHYPRAVKAFYTNLLNSSQPSPPTRALCSDVGGVSVEFTEAVINTVFRLPPGGISYYCPSIWYSSSDFDPLEAVRAISVNKTTTAIAEFPSSSLTPEARLVHNIITYSILPKSGSRSLVSIMEAFLVYCVMTGRKVNLAFLFISAILECHKKKGALIFPTHLSYLLGLNGVPLADEPTEHNPIFLDRTHLKQMHIGKNADGVLVSLRAAPPADQAGPSVPRPDAPRPEAPRPEAPTSSFPSLGSDFDIPDFGFGGNPETLTQILEIVKRNEEVQRKMAEDMKRLEDKVDSIAIAMTDFRRDPPPF